MAVVTMEAPLLNGPATVPPELAKAQDWYERAPREGWTRRVSTLHPSHSNPLPHSNTPGLRRFDLRGEFGPYTMDGRVLEGQANAFARDKLVPDWLTLNEEGKCFVNLVGHETLALVSYDQQERMFYLERYFAPNAGRFVVGSFTPGWEASYQHESVYTD